MSLSVCLAEPETKKQDTIAFCTHRGGTGGCSIGEMLHTPGPMLHAPRLYGIGSLKPAIESDRSPSEQLQFIRQHLCLTMSDLASLLGVSRPTAYAWLGGDEPKGDNYANIVRLSRIAGQFEALNLAHLDRLLRRPVFEGRSLLDRLKAEEDISDCLPFLKALAAKEATSRRAPKGSGKSREDQGVRDLSTPIYEPS